MYKNKEKDLLLSLILGDGCILKRGMSYGINIGHGESQKDYLQWKINLLDESKLFNTPIKMNTKIVKLNQKKFLQYKIEKTNKNLKEIYDIAISDSTNKKNVPSILDYLKSNRSLAIWFMDDGSVFKRKRKHKDGSIYYLKPTLKLCTHCFSYEENLIIKDWFKRKYLLDCKIEHETKRGKTYYYIRFNSDESKKIFNLTKRYLLEIDSMRNKFSYFIQYYN